MPNIIIRDKILGNPYVWKQTRDLLFSFTNKPTFTQQRNINETMNSLVVSGLFAKHDLIRVEASHDSQSGTINWKTPGTFTSTRVNSPTHTAFQGIAGNGTTSYVNNNFIPSTNGVQYATNSACHYVYDRTNAAANVYVCGIIATASSLLISPRGAANIILGTVNDFSTGLNPASTDSRGLTAVNRSASNARQIYKNGVSGGSDATVSISLPNISDFMCGINNNGVFATPTTDQLSIRGFSANLSDNEQLLLYNIWQKYMTNMGTQV